MYDPESTYWVNRAVQPVATCCQSPYLHKSQTPLIRFVVDLLYNKLYNKSTTNRKLYNKSTLRCCTTNRKPPASPQQIEPIGFSCKPAIVIVTSLSLWRLVPTALAAPFPLRRHSHYNVSGTRSPHFHYHIILIVTSFATELATPAVADVRTYVTDTLPCLIYKDAVSKHANKQNSEHERFCCSRAGLSAGHGSDPTTNPPAAHGAVDRRRSAQEHHPAAGEWPLTWPGYSSHDRICGLSMSGSFLGFPKNSTEISFDFSGLKGHEIGRRWAVFAM